MPSVEGWEKACIERFRSEWGRPPEWMATAPGRVNLIGEHTDYTGGLVLPCAIDLRTLVLAAPRADSRIRIRSWDLDQSEEFSPNRLKRRGNWVDYVQGVCWALTEQSLAVPGLDLAVASQLPLGSGLSSSAALTLGLASVLTAAAGQPLPPQRLAQVAHRAENGFAGLACGIMDPFVSALGRRGHALRIDCRTEAVNWIPIAEGLFDLLLVHSGVARRLTEGIYETRVEECGQALEKARRHHLLAPGKRSLRDFSRGDLPELEAVLPPRIYRRARHVILENARVEDFCRALEEEQPEKLGELLIEGHVSLRDDYEVSIPELDTLCELGAECESVIGSRLTGAGFGGCTLHLVRPGQLDSAEEFLSQGFARRFQRSPVSYRVMPAAGASCMRILE